MNRPVRYSFTAILTTCFFLLCHAYKDRADSPLTFSTPFAYDGIKLAGDPFFLQCAENGMKHLDECSGLKVCVTSGNTHYSVIQKYLPERHIVQKDMAIDGGIMGGYIRGECNLFAGVVSGIPQSSPPPSSKQPPGVGTGNGTSPMSRIAIGKSYFSREPNATMTRQDDPEFSDFVNAILLALLAAEQKNITQSNAHLMPSTTLFGHEYKDMFRSAVAFAGNFDDSYKTLFGRSTVDTINNRSTGLLYPHPFGEIGRDRNGRALGTTLAAILRSGQLRCGVLIDRPGFAIKEGHNYMGMDADFCRGLAASLFGGDIDAVVFVEVEDVTDGYNLLASEEIDVLAGATWTLETDVREPTTGQGYSFSPAYFYGYSDDKDNFSLATRQEDPDWSSFVYWVVTGTFYAEDNNINSIFYFDMPEVFIFGPGLRQMFRSLILAVGSYADIYERNLEPFFPRFGRNWLNDMSDPGPQQYVIPGFD
jgi:hypothetical protein